MVFSEEELVQKKRQLYSATSSGYKFRRTVFVWEIDKKLIENKIKNSNLTIAPIDLKIETFRRMYKHDFSEEEFKNIFNFFRKRESHE